MRLTHPGFHYVGNVLYCEQVPISKIIREYGSPSYIYSRLAITNQVQRFRHALGGLSCEIFFAVKACSNIFILDLLRQLGCGADIVSGGELFRAAAAKIAPGKIVFSGVGKTDKEILEALKAEIYCFNVESIAELKKINSLAKSLSVRPNLALRINPNINAKTHPYISTGLRENKFGLAKIELDEIFKTFRKFSNVNFLGLSCHIGSQITSSAPFQKAWEYLLKVARAAPFKVKHLNLGGGLGIAYGSEKTLSIEQYGSIVAKTFANTGYEIGIEPGRSIIGPSSLLVSSLISIKKRGNRSFYIIDAGMNDLLRPALYQSIHSVIPIHKKSSPIKTEVDVVGPICETADVFIKKANLPVLEPGALLAFTNAGAYGMSMASQYNSRPRAPEILVSGSDFSLIRSRESYADLIKNELI